MNLQLVPRQEECLDSSERHELLELVLDHREHLLRYLSRPKCRDAQLCLILHGKQRNDTWPFQSEEGVHMLEDKRRLSI